MNNQSYKILLNQFKNCQSDTEKTVLLATEKERITHLSTQESLNEIQYFSLKVKNIENKIAIVQHEI